MTRHFKESSKKQTTFPEFSHSEHTRFGYRSQNPYTPTDLTAASRFNPLPITSTLFWALFCVSWACGIHRFVGSSRQQSPHTSIFLHLAPITTASQNATKKRSTCYSPQAPMLGHYTTTRPRKSSPSAVDIANVVLHVPSPPRTKSPKASDDTPLQLQRELVDGIPSDILPEPFIQREGNVVSPLNHPTKPFVIALPPEERYSPLTSNMTAPLSSCTRPS